MPAGEEPERARRRPLPRGPSQVGPVLAGVVIIIAGFGIAIVEALHLPKGSVWGVVALAVAVVALIRALTPRR